MKKIINKISTICFMIFDAFVDFLFCVRLLHDLKNQPYDEYQIKNIKVLLQFLASSFDKSPFEYYNLNNEEYLYLYYLSLKHKNSGIFKGFIFIYTFLVSRFLAPILEYVFTTNKVYKFTSPLNNKLVKQIKNNFGYEYLRDYKEYYKNNLEYYNKIKYKVFIKETLFNIYRYFWRKKKNKNCDDLWRKQFNLVGKYFNKNKKNKPINLNNWFELNIERYF